MHRLLGEGLVEACKAAPACAVCRRSCNSPHQRTGNLDRSWLSQPPCAGEEGQLCGAMAAGMPCQSAWVHPIAAHGRASCRRGTHAIKEDWPGSPVADPIRKPRAFNQHSSRLRTMCATGSAAGRRTSGVVEQMWLLARGPPGPLTRSCMPYKNESKRETLPAPRGWKDPTPPRVMTHRPDF